MSDVIMVTTSKWQAMCAMVASGAFVMGVLFTVVIWACRQAMHERHAKMKVITILDSPQPTRLERLMTSASHRRMAESTRARRRGGRRRQEETCVA